MPFKLLVMVLLEPNKAFSIIKERPWTLMFVPFVIALVGQALLLLWYYQVVDLTWLQHNILPAATEAQRQAMAKFMSRTTMSITGVLGAVVVIPIIYALVAGYFTLVSKVKGSAVDFGHWFSFAVWYSVPGLLLIPLGMVVILMSPSGQIAPSQLDPASLNQLIFHLPSSSGWGKLLDAVSLPMFWSCFLSVIGFRNWTESSGVGSVLLPLAPYIVFFGGWIAILVLRGGA